MCNSAAHNARKGRESLSKRLGKVARQIKARDGERCVYCARTKEESGAYLQLDHLIPRSAGGQDTAENLVVACRRCNSARQDMTLQAWAMHARLTLNLIFSAKDITERALATLPEVK